MIATTGSCVPEHDAATIDHPQNIKVTLTDQGLGWFIKYPHLEESEQELRRRELMKRERELWRMRR